VNAAIKLYIIFALLIISACSTKKSTWVTRTYHNTTNRFNIRFNATEAYKEGIRKIEKQNEDYTQLLPIYNQGTEASAKSADADMEKAIKKSSQAIQRHSIFIRGFEHCKWVDDNYFLIGQSYFIKREYFTAIENFDYVSKQYKKETTHFDAMIWLARTYGELGNVNDARQMITTLEDDKKLPKQKRELDLPVAKANFHLKEKEYPQAAEQLALALKKVKRRYDKVRYNYILAQLYEQQEDRANANKYYAKVVKYKPNSDILFFAKIARARNFEGTDPSKLKRELLSMISDAKYVDFKDQIYYALAELSERVGNKDDEIKYLNLCVREVSTNKRQHSLAHLRLANIYYAQEQYKTSYLHYDSALTGVNKQQLPNYIELDNRRGTLKRLVANLDTIANEDSLQRLAAMSPYERSKFIQNYIDTEVKKEEDAKQKKAQELQASANENKNTTDIQGGWYFYNALARGKGVQDFAAKWGTRPLEDNWRRSSKEAVNPQDTEQEKTEEEQPNKEEKEKNTAISSPKPKEEKSATVSAENKNTKSKIETDLQVYLKTLPLTDTLLSLSTSRIVNAYYGAASLYREELMNNQKSIGMFEELLKRYPENKFKLVTYYQLYRLYLTEKNQTMADKYKNIILKDYEFTEYGQLISNPEYNLQSEKAKAKAGKLYEQAFEAYKESEYASVLSISNTALKLYKSNDLTPKFLYLKALAEGKTKNLSTMVDELNQLIAKYPQDPIKAQAQAVLDAVAKNKVNDNNVNNGDTTTFYKQDAAASALFIALFTTDNKIEELKNAVADFNSGKFESQQLAVSTLVFDQTNTLLIIKPFTQNETATNYFKTIKTEVFVSKTGNWQQFLITQDNLTKLYNSKRLTDYVNFFTENYTIQ
jgi:tetratricopeptide (TPR) repeat protein